MRLGAAQVQGPFPAALDIDLDQFAAAGCFDVAELKQLVNELVMHAWQRGRLR